MNKRVKFNLTKSLEILERTPLVIESMLKGVSDEWVMANEGKDTWSPYDIVGHYIHGEKTDWIPRLEIILSGSPNKEFAPFDRFAQMQDSKGKKIQELIEDFKSIRAENIVKLKSKNIRETDFLRKGFHPSLGDVTIAQLISTWVVHDLNHIAQISRVMAKQYKDDVGPWVEYLGILK
jgi:hypothetical protein